MKTSIAAGQACCEIYGKDAVWFRTLAGPSARLWLVIHGAEFIFLLRLATFEMGDKAHHIDCL